MIVVLADDFSGAAEIAATARRYGLLAEVHTTFQAGSSADVVVVDTDTRSATSAQAELRVATEVRRLREGGVESVYFKKVDSVLRGHVVAELHLLLGLLRMERAVLAPFNPSYGQAIVDGRYTIDGVPLHRTRFAEDPEYPATTSDVLDLLTASGTADGEDFGSDRPIVVWEGSDRTDLVELVRRLDARTLPAGGAELFDVLLQHWVGRGRARPPATDPLLAPGRGLVVVGSIARGNWTVVDAARRLGVPVLPIPAAPGPEGGPLTDEWAADVLRALDEHPWVVVAAGDEPPVPRADLPARLIPARIADMVRSVERVRAGDLHLVISGGATASMAVRRIGWKALRVVGEAGRGTVTLAPPDRPGRLLTVKPGSYPWPDALAQCLQ